MKKIQLPSLLLLCTILNFHAPKNDWVFVKEQDGIKVWYRAEGSGGIHAFKSESVIECGLAGIVQLFLEAENYRKWGYKVLESKLVRQVTQQDFFYYNRYDFPWPLEDRDCVMRNQITQDPSTRAITFDITAAPDELPEKPSVIRLRAAYAHWTLTPLGDGRTAAVQIVRTEPGGNVPAWVANKAADEGMIKNLNGIRSRLKEGNYAGAHLTFIKD